MRTCTTPKASPIGASTVTTEIHSELVINWALLGRLRPWQRHVLGANAADKRVPPLGPCRVLPIGNLITLPVKPLFNLSSQGRVGRNKMTIGKRIHWAAS